MNRLSRIGYVILVLAILLPILKVIFDFFNIKSKAYFPYMLWMIALGMFYAFLPNYVGEVFM